MYKMYINGILFPVTPSKIVIKTKNQNKTINLIDEGEVNLLKDTGLMEVQIDKLLIPNHHYPFAVYTGVFHRAKYYLDKLTAWKASGKSVTFLFVRKSPNKIDFGSTRIKASIEELQFTEDTGNGMDVEVKLTLKQYKDVGIKKLVRKKKKSSSNGSKKTTVTVKKHRASKSIAKSYTVVKGDCLIKIAKSQLNDSGRWREIYTLNKNIIESNAKKHGRKSSSDGWWIYPGTKLKLPK